MGLGTPVPIGPEEKKAFNLFMRDYNKIHQGIDRKDVNWKGMNAWGRLNPKQKEMYAQKSAFPLNSKSKPVGPKALLKKAPLAQKKKPNGVKPKPKPKPKPRKVPLGNPKGKKAGKEQPSRKDDQSAKKEDVLTKKDFIANSVVPNVNLNQNQNPYYNDDLDPCFEGFEPASVEAIPQKKVRQVKKKANGPRVPVSAANKRKSVLQKRAGKTNKKLAADKGKNKKAPKKAIKKKCLKKNQNQPKKETVKDLKNPEVPETPETPEPPETPKKRFYFF